MFFCKKAGVFFVKRPVCFGKMVGVLLFVKKDCVW